MKTLKLLIVVFFLIVTAQLSAQNAEQTVREAEKSINQKIDELHQLAAQKQIHAAFDKIDEINKEISREITWSTFDEKYKEAKMKNPGFTFNIKGELPAQLSTEYWADFEQKCNKILADQEIIIEGMQSAILLNKMDKCLAYGKQLKTLYETVSGVVENLGTGNLPKFAYDLYQNSKEAVENYVEGENAYVEGLEIEAAKAKWNLTISKTKKSKEQYDEFRRYIKSNQIAINDFNAHIKYLNTLKQSASSGVLAPLNYADHKYNWNYEPFTKEVNKSCADFELYEIKCEDFKTNFEDINRRARKDWTTVKGNISASDDNGKKKEFLDYHNERWIEYLGIINTAFNKIYNKHCGAASQEKKIAELIPATVLPPEKKQEELQETEEEKPLTDKNENIQQNEQTQANTATPVVPEKKAEPQKIPAIKINTSDKYWENTLPENTETEWLFQSYKYGVKHMENGRSICYQWFYDSDFKQLSHEYFNENFAIRHGPFRYFYKDVLTNEVWLSQTGYYRLNKKIGPWVNYNKDQSVSSIEYYIDNEKVESNIYQQKRQQDNSIPPADCYKNYDWVTIKTPMVKEKPQLTSMADFNKMGFVYPNKFGNLNSSVDVGKLWNPDQPNEALYISGKITASNTQQLIGNWYGYLYPQKNIINFQSLYYGQLCVFRYFKNDGSPDRLYFRMTKNLSNSFAFLKTESEYIGPYLSNKNGENKIEYHDGKGNVISKDQYKKMYDINKDLPHPDIWSQQESLKTPEYVTFPIKNKLTIDENLGNIGKNAKIWDARLSNNEFEINLLEDHSLNGNLVWYNIDQKATKLYRYKHGFYSVLKSWYPNGKLHNFVITPDIGFEYRIEYDDKGILIKETSEQNNTDIKNLNIYKKYLPEFEFPKPKTPSLVTSKFHEFEIPKGELTPLYLAYIKELQNPTPQTSINELLASSSEPNEKVSDNPKIDDKTNYQQLQREELFKLLEEINKKVEAADKSFDKPYWEDNKTGTATMQATNPKQESLDILRSAVPIIERAKYPENKGGLYHLVAIKLVNYSGRVFAYNAKQDFFKLAAELVNKADQLLTSNIYLKDDLSEAYCTSAEIWRDMTQKALWGDHAYNKMACDKMVIQQYERAVQANPNNQKARKMLEQLKAPKPAIPAAVAQFKEIDNDTWNEAQKAMFRLNDELTEEQTKEKSEIHPIIIAEMTINLNIGNGSVSIKRSGSENWEEVTDQRIEIYIGDVIKTSDDAKDVSVTYPDDKTFLAIKSGSEVEFQNQQLYIRRGNAYLQVVKTGNKFVVVGPSSATGLRGTQVEVQVNADKTTETYLYEGLVEIRTVTDIGYLVPGQKMIAKKGEEKLQQTIFNTNERLKWGWAELENQRRKHDQILVDGASTSNKASSSNNTNNAALDPFSDLSSNSNSNSPFPSIPETVQFSWSPAGTFSPVMVQEQIKFGTHNLIARIAASVNTNTPVTVNWYLNNQLVSTGKHTILKEAGFFDGQIVTGGEPINPGKYKVEFVINNEIHKRGEIEIIAPEKLDQQKATQKYVVALQAMQQALDLVDQGDLYNAGIKASTVLNDLRTVLYSAPLLPDIQAVTEINLALMSFTEIIHATNNAIETEANEWVKRSLGHARRSNQLCKDPKFKVSTSKIVNALEEAFPGF